MAICLLIPVSLTAQSELKKFKSSSLTFMPFASIGTGAISTVEDFEKLSPNSSLIPKDLSGYTVNNQNVSSGSAGASILLGFKLRNKEGTGYRPNPVLRIGMSYYYNGALSSSAYKDEKFAYDTLTSGNTGDKIPVDSVALSSYSMNYTSQQLRLDASLIYKTDPEARWNFFAGFGATVGASISSQTNISNYNSYYFNPTLNEDFNNLYLFDDFTGETEATKNETNIAYSAYVPLGLDFRVANKSEFWKRVHLFYEMRSSVNMLSIPELGTYTTLDWQHGFGVRVQWQ